VRELENMLHRAVALSDGGAGFELANLRRKSPCLPICRITLICGNATHLVKGADGATSIAQQQQPSGIEPAPDSTVLHG
jgi:hypothetical protein